VSDLSSSFVAPWNPPSSLPNSIIDKHNNKT
jgi:hypothetical protein